MLNAQQKGGGKRATRGQRQIYEENKQTVFSYLMASICSAVLVFSLNYFIFQPTNGTWVGLVISTVCQLSAVGLMSMMMKAVRSEKNQIVDAGLDLNDPNAFGEYCKDTVILSVASQLLSLAWSPFLLLLLLLPAFALFKIWVNFLGPWFFAPAPESMDDKDDKRKQKHRQKFVHVKR